MGNIYGHFFDSIEGVSVDGFFAVEDGEVFVKFGTVAFRVRISESAQSFCVDSAGKILSPSGLCPGGYELVVNPAAGKSPIFRFRKIKGYTGSSDQGFEISSSDPIWIVAGGPDIRFVREMLNLGK